MITEEKIEKKDNLKDSIAIGDVVEGTVIAIEPSTIYIDLSPFGTGIIYGREYLIAREMLKKTKIGDTISAKVISFDVQDGKYIDLSLKEARNAMIWTEAERSMKSGTVYEIVPKSANRGGLIVEWNGVRGFIPASQLSEENYPKILSANKDAVLSELKKLVGKKLSVVIMDADQNTDYLIFSEKKDGEESERLETENMEVKYEVGDVKSGVVTGVVDFGVFVKLNEKIEGLVHISEMDWGLVDDPRRFFSVGDPITVKIIEADEKYSFSVKALKKNPWESAGDKYKNGDLVQGVVFKYGENGCFASIEAGVSGIIPISYFKDEIDLRNNLEIGKTYDFIINNFNAKEQKLTLVPKDKYKEDK